MQRGANKIRVSAQLIDARTDAHLWAQTYDRDLADVFAIQSEIAKAIPTSCKRSFHLTRRKRSSNRPRLIWRHLIFTVGRNHFSSRQLSARRASRTSARQSSFWMRR